MQGDFECLLDDDGFKHIDIQIQRRSERHGRTPGFNDSNVKQSCDVCKIDATRSEFVGSRQVGFLLKQRNIWPMV